MSPAAGQPRCLILCFDGTSNQYDETNTNVVKFFSLLKKDDPEKQLVYYQAGIGTYANPGMWNHFVAGVSKLADLAVAWYLEAHVMSGYSFLMKHYRAGDKICLFGFSRGAYTARALAGMLHKVGLLPPDNNEQVPFAYQMYRREDAKAMRQALGFKATFSRSVTIDFLGVWDTVSSVGLIIPRHLPFTSSSHIIRVFRHAISLDEHRAKFQINLWHRNAPTTSEAKKDPERGSGVVGEMSPRLGVVDLDRAGELSRRESLQKATDIEEVWFAGCHGDVGGGSVLDSAIHSLAAITLRWMVRECALTQTGILFDNDALRRAGIPQDSFRLSSAFKGFKRKLHGSPLPLSIAEHLEADYIGIGEVMAGDGLRLFDNGDQMAAGSSPTSSMEHPLPHLHVPPPNREAPLQPSPPPAGYEGRLTQVESNEYPKALISMPRGADGNLEKPRNPLPTPKTLESTSRILEPAVAHPGTSKPVPDVNKSPFGSFIFKAKRQRSPKTPPSTVTTTRGLPINGTHSAEHTAEDHYRMSIHELDEEDALSPLHDELTVQPLWWVLEWVPFLRATQDEDGYWKEKIRINVFRGRKIPAGKKIKVHSSVKTRMEAGIGYTPKARWSIEPEWVD